MAAESNNVFDDLINVLMLIMDALDRGNVMEAKMRITLLLGTFAAMREKAAEQQKAQARQTDDEGGDVISDA